ATGCDPADPAGPFCIPSSGTPTEFLDAPPWTFVAPAAGALLTVTDAFLAGDRFQVFDFGASLGLTSAPVGNADCGDDPIPCLALIALAWVAKPAAAQEGPTSFSGPTSSQPLALTADDAFLVVANPDNNSVSFFDMRFDRNRRLATVPVQIEPNGVAILPNGS